MNPREFVESLDQVALRDGASEQELLAASRRIGEVFTAEYFDLLRLSNGLHGFTKSGSYLDLWPIHQIGERNRSYKVDLKKDGLLLFGSDGGLEAFAFDVFSPGLIVRVPFIPLERSQAISVGRGLQSLLDPG
jgi:hypothetical protein